MEFTFGEHQLPKNGVLVLGVLAKETSSDDVKSLDKHMEGALQKAISDAQFEGNKDQTLSMWAPNGLDIAQLVLVGLGDLKDAGLLECEELGAKIALLFSKTKQKKITLAMPKLDLKKTKDFEVSAAIANGFNLKWWSFDKYKTKTKPEDKPCLETVHVFSDDVKKSDALFNDMQIVSEGVFKVRDVVSEPGNVINPDTMVQEAEKLKALGVEVEVLGEKEMKKLGFNALLGVGQGSAFESRLVILKWNGGKKDDAPFAVVGKGVTFDSGGLSIKPAASMEDMKMDMGGAGVVLGLMQTLAKRKAKTNVVGVMGLVENMPSGTAQRPGDVVKSLSGQTIEILNTDAEGRLVLADALWYTQDRFKPKAMVNLATLTGAIIVCLSHEYAGLFSNNDDLCEALTASGQSTGEKIWRFPMGPVFDKDINSDIADMKNIGSGRGAGSITAAQFLQRFINDVPWAHLDIAGVAWDTKDRPLARKGASGFGVRLLNDYIAKAYEKA